MNDSQAVLIGLAVVTTTILGITVLWATNRRASLLARLAPLAILLSLFMPTGMFDAAAIFAAQAVLVLCIVGLVRMVLRRRRLHFSACSPADRVPTPAGAASLAKFSLTDLLKGIVLAAAICALVSYAPDEVDDSFWGSPSFWPSVLGVGALLAAITLAAWGLAIARGRWLLLFPCVAVVLLVGILQSIELLPTTVKLNWLPIIVEHPEVVVFLSATVLLTGIVLRLLSAARWDWWTNSTPPSPEAIATTTIHAAATSSSRTAKVALACLALLCLTPLANLYYVLLPPQSLPTQALPIPNGHTELVRLEGLLNWNAIPHRDPDAASPAECEKFVQDNSLVIRSIQQALSLKSQVPIDWGNPLVLHGAPMRTLYRVQDMRARAAILAGHPREACDCYVDAMRIGLIASRGGLAVDELTAAAIEKTALEHLLPLLNDLDEDSLAGLEQKLQSILNSREPLPAMLEREQLFAQVSLGWQGRLYGWFQNWGLGEGYFDTPAEIPKFRQRQDTDLELLIVETALFRYLLTHAAPPNSLSTLVPKYLKRIPNDRYGTGPLAYRRTENGYLLYSLGENGIDDGGMLPSHDDRTAGDHLLNPSP